LVEGLSRSRIRHAKRRTTMYPVRGLRKVTNSNPQQFELWLTDPKNKKDGYLFTTKYGTEPEVRTMLKEAGVPEADIDRLFRQAVVAA
jgi:hypothetical protein